jgi:heme A synthase
MHRFAAALAGLTFLLLLLGGIVHNTGSSLACPDWPLCHGTAFPRMVGGVLVEHSHRLVAGSVVLLAGVLMALMIRRGVRARDRGLSALGIGLFTVVLWQAALGAITVKLRLPPLVSTGHLATSMVFFTLVIYSAFRLRQFAAPPLSPRVQRLTAWAAALVYAQMVLGAAVRHLGAGLACTDLPLCRGSLWPADGDLGVHLHIAHRALALVALGLVVAASVAAWRGAGGRSSVRALAAATPLLVLLQITLGVLTITSFRDIVPLTAHLGVAALLLACLVSLHLVARGQLGRAAATPPTGALAEAAA